MIRQVKGKVLARELQGVVVEVAGFGLFLYTPEPERYALGGEVTFATHLAVKQDGIELYGFSEEADRNFFELLLSVSGVGPKTALSVMKRAPRAHLESAIGRRDHAYLTRVAGMGKKAAEKMVVELSEKLTHVSTGGEGEDAEVFDTLIALGYTEREARKAVGAIAKEIVGKEERLRAALSSGRSYV